MKARKTYEVRHELLVYILFKGKGVQGAKEGKGATRCLFFVVALDFTRSSARIGSIAM
jgi:aerobic-type carbon monoxide dehydrogenase small subunit (CoxS/CutS family)